MSSGSILKSIEAQQALLSWHPMLENFLSHQARGGRKIKIFVLRNFPFEIMEAPIKALLSLCDMDAEFEYSAYDPALVEANLYQGEHHIVIIWIDWRFLSVNDLSPSNWLRERVEALRQKTNKPIIINNWPFSLDATFSAISSHFSENNVYRAIENAVLEVCRDFPEMHFWDINNALALRNIDPWDSRLDSISSFPFSKISAMALGQVLGSQIIPQLFDARLKAIFLDLDNTLYCGVLGEGMQTIVAKEYHRRMHRFLLALKNSGILLVLITKNDEQDVLDCISKGILNPLKINDFAFIKANWQPKSHSIAECLEIFNFSPKDCLFIDDNPAELSEVLHQIPLLNAIHAADSTGQHTFHSLVNFPRIYGLKVDPSAAKRQRDVVAQQQRKTLQQTCANQFEYIRELEIQLVLTFNNLEELDRLVSMSNKTNQFNLAMKRLNAAEIRQFFNKPNLAVAVHLKDRFADSGVVGAFLLAAELRHCTFSEILFSCRALGRDVESVALLQVLKVLRKIGFETCSFVATQGPRNQPALNWYESFRKKTDSQAIDSFVSVLEQKYSNYPGSLIIKEN